MSCCCRKSAKVRTPDKTCIMHPARQSNCSTHKTGDVRLAQQTSDFELFAKATIDIPRGAAKIDAGVKVSSPCSSVGIRVNAAVDISQLEANVGAKVDVKC